MQPIRINNLDINTKGSGNEIMLETLQEIPSKHQCTLIIVAVNVIIQTTDSMHPTAFKKIHLQYKQFTCKFFFSDCVCLSILVGYITSMSY